MRFASFKGLNHHRQLICFGTALLRDEKVKLFLWLFSNILNVMGSHMLKTIIIDQGPAIKQATANVFDMSIH